MASLYCQISMHLDDLFTQSVAFNIPFNDINNPNFEII